MENDSSKTVGDVGISGSDLTDDLDGWRKLLERRVDRYGDVFLLCAGSGPSTARAVGFSLAATQFRLPGDGGAAFEHIYVLPLAALENDEAVTAREAEFAEALKESLIRQFPGSDMEVVWPVLSNRIQMLRVPDRQTSSLTAALHDVERRSAVFVASSEMYHSPTINIHRPGIHASAPLGQTLHLSAPEDGWAPQLQNTVHELSKIARERELFIFASTDVRAPVRLRNRALLESLNCTTFYIEPSEETKLIDLLERWTIMVRAGELDRFEQELAAAKLSDINRALARAQCLLGGGRGASGFRDIQPLLEKLASTTDAGLHLVVARVAASAGEYKTACEFLSKVATGALDDETGLGSAIQLASTLGMDETKRTLEARMQRLYPRAQILLSERIRIAFADADYQAVLAHVEKVDPNERSAHTRYMALAAAALSVPTVPDYNAFFETVRNAVPQYEQQAVLHAARDALMRHSPIQAIQLVIGREWDDASRTAAVNLLIDAIERSYRIDEITDNGEVHEAVRLVVKYLSDRPIDRACRVRLADVLSMENSAMRGVVHLAKIAFDASLPSTSENVSTVLTGSVVAAEVFNQFSRAVANELKSKVHVLGEGKLPSSLPDTPARLLSTAARSLEFMAGSTLADSEDVDGLRFLLHVSLVLARVAGGPTDDFSLIKLAAGGLCVAGDFQTARDLADHALMRTTPTDSGARKRAAWAMFADAYHRAHNIVEALLALACTAVRTEEVELLDLYDELLLRIRLLRDMQLTGRALALLPHAHELLHRLGKYEEYQHRLQLLELSIILRELVRGSTIDMDEGRKDAFEAAVTWLVRLNREARERNDELLPTAVLLAQAVVDGSSLPEALLAEARAEFDQSIALVGEPNATRLRVLAGQGPVDREFAAFNLGLDRTRFASDLGSDVAQLHSLAARALGPAVLANDLGRAAHAIEWMTDRSIRTPQEVARSATRSTEGRWLKNRVYDWMSERLVRTADETLARMAHEFTEEINGDLAAAPRSPMSPLESRDYLLDLSRRPCTIHMLGFDRDHLLIRLTASGGSMTLDRESTETFSSDAYFTWREHFPHRYGDEENFDTRSFTGIADVEQTLAGIGIRGRGLVNPVVLIVGGELQQLPANLLLLDGELAGMHSPIASAPSLTWLKASRELPRPNVQRRSAWMFTPSETEIGGLGAMRSGIEPVLERAGIPLSVSRDPPHGLQGADLAIIGAHGFLAMGNSFFNVVADEHQVRFSVREMAQAVAGAGVVVLFVCSGGRADVNPFAWNAIGLQKTLLDHGCRTVIAPPWSLDVSVPARWLPAFLDAFDGGATVVDAVFAANQAVRRFSQHPSHFLAMHVFGDPFTVK